MYHKAWIDNTLTFKNPLIQNKPPFTNNNVQNQSIYLYIFSIYNRSIHIIQLINTIADL
eukprot:UN04947